MQDRRAGCLDEILILCSKLFVSILPPEEGSPLYKLQPGESRRIDSKEAVYRSMDDASLRESPGSSQRSPATDSE
jgi:hypothetical protein